MSFQVYLIEKPNLGELSNAACCHKSSSASSDNEAGRSSSYSCKTEGRVPLSITLWDLLMVAGNKERNSVRFCDEFSAQSH